MQNSRMAILTVAMTLVAVIVSDLLNRGFPVQSHFQQKDQNRCCSTLAFLCSIEICGKGSRALFGDDVNSKVFVLLAEILTLERAEYLDGPAESGGADLDGHRPHLSLSG